MNRRAPVCHHLSRQRRLITTLLLQLAFATHAAAQSADLTAQFQRTLDAVQKEYDFPGATAAYVLPNGQVGVAASGMADVKTATPMTSHSRMLAASIGKTFVGATMMSLAHKKQLALDDLVSQWLGNRDWFTRVPNHHSMTLRHLLNHTSGLPDHVNNPTFQAAVSKQWRGARIPFTPEELVAFVLDQPPEFEAGQSWAYSDTGFILLGLVIEKVTGQDYFEVVHTTFIEPLELADTTPSNRVDLRDLATGYLQPDNHFGLPPETTNRAGIMVWNPGIEWTGGGWVSTSRDLATWGAALFQGRAMSAPYLDDLLAGVPIDANEPDLAYGLAVAIYRRGRFGPVYGHGGWIPGYSSSLRYYADHMVCIAFQINTDIGIVDHSTPVVRELERRLAQVIIDSPAVDKLQ